MDQKLETNNTNGAAAAALTAAGIGALAMGLIALFADLRVITLTPLISSMGGLSTKVVLSSAIWLIAWFALHRAWVARDIDLGRIRLITAGLVLLGLLGAFPPFWGLFKG